MAILTSIESGFNCLYNRQSELDKLISKFTLSNEERYKMEKLKSEISDILTDILALQCEDVLSSSFYLQVNNIEQEIYNILEEKRKKLNKLVAYKDGIYETIDEILAIIYSIDILEKSFHVNADSQAYLLEIKNLVSSKEVSDKKILALEYIKEKLPAYKQGILDIILIANKNILKRELPFEKKQEIFDIFSSISLKTQRVKNHTKVFNEDYEINNESKYTLDYLEWFENIFLDMGKYVNLYLDSYCKEIKNMIYNNVVTYENVENIADYIFNRYKNEIDKYLEKITNFRDNSESNIRRQLKACLDYDGITDYKQIINSVIDNKELPDYLKDSICKEKLNNILFELNVPTSNKVKIQNVLGDLREAIISCFDETKYLELYKYKYNSSLKTIQIASYRQYYLSTLEAAREKVKQDYIDKIEDIVSKKQLKPYSNAVLLRQIEKLKKDIELLKEALKYISKNYRDFSNTNLKLYINSIQSRYQIYNLYDNILAKKSNFVYKLMAKSKLNEEKRLLYDFANKREIKEKLQNELMRNIFIDSNELKEEIICSLS